MADLRLTFTGDSHGAVAAAKDVDRALGGVEKAATRTSRISTKALAGIAVGGFTVLAGAAKLGFDEFSQGQKVQAQTEAALKSTGGAANVTAKHVSDLAGDLLKLSGVDDEAIQSGENLLLTFTPDRRPRMVGRVGSAARRRAAPSARPEPARRDMTVTPAASPRSTTRDETRASITGAVLERLDPTLLDTSTTSLLEQLGPYLALGLNHAEIGRRLRPPRTDEWVGARVREIRKALAANVLENAGDDLDPDVRVRLEAHCRHGPSRT